MAAPVQIDYTPPPTIRRFMLDDTRVRGLVGPLGSGKSSGCVMDLLTHAATQRPGRNGIRRSRWLAARNTFPQLRDTTRKTFEFWARPEETGIGSWRERDFACDLRFNDVECEVLFRALDNPSDVGKVLSLDLTGAWLNEAREMPKEILDGLQGRVGRYPAMVDGGPSWYGIILDTNPWPTSHWGYELFTKQRPPGFALYEQPSGLGPSAENLENLPPGYYRDLQAGKDAEWIEEYLEAKYPNADKGSVFGEWLAKLEQRQGICEFSHPSDGIYATFDLGISDATAIWFWRFNESRAVDIVDHYESHGQGAAHYFQVLRDKGYRYERIFLPHDARARSLQTGISTLDLFLKEYPDRVAITPELSVSDGIGAARWLLEQPMRIHSRCVEGLKRLRGYRFEWSEDKKVFSKKPMHDWASHSADSFRYVACAVQGSEVLSRPAPPVPALVINTSGPSFDDLMRQSSRGARPRTIG